MKEAKAKKLKPLFVLIVIVPRGKMDVVQDVLEDFEVTASMRVGGHGTGGDEPPKDIVMAVIREDRAKQAIYTLEDKFERFHKNMSMVYAVPMEALIGASSYLFLAKEGKQNAR